MATYTEIRQLIKDLRGIANKAKNDEIQSKIFELQDFIGDLREQNMDLKDQIRDLRDQLANANKKSIDRDSLSLFHDVFVDKDKLRDIQSSQTPFPDELLEHMYCTKCLQKDDKKSILQGINENGSYGLKCPVCGFETWFGPDPRQGAVMSFN